MKYMNNHYGMSRVFGKARCKMPMNLQYFAEGGEGDAGAEGGAGGASGTSEGTGDAGDNQGDQGAAGSSMSFDDYLKDPKNQAEFDRRVSKALETSRTKMQADIEKQIADAKTEAEKMAKMNADQKAQYEREKQEKELADREAAITKRELTATAKEQLAEKGLPISLATILNYTNAEECAASIDAVGKAFQEAVEKAVTDRLAGGKPPKKADGSTAWSSLFKWIGKKMNEEVMEEIKCLKKSDEEICKKQAEIERQQAIDTADTIKAEVFSFYNECKRGLKHSEAEFNHIAQQNKKYMAIIEVTKEPNGVYEAEYEYIMEIFKEAMTKNDFL